MPGSQASFHRVPPGPDEIAAIGKRVDFSVPTPLRGVRASFARAEARACDQARACERAARAMLQAASAVSALIILLHAPRGGVGGMKDPPD